MPLDRYADPLLDPVGNSLTTAHRALALQHGQAACYPASVAPFASVLAPTTAALNDLAVLLKPDQAVFLIGARPPNIDALRWTGKFPGLQMTFPLDAPLPAARPGFTIQPLTCDDAPEMLALIEIAFPGFFRAETCRMGRYFGLRNPAGDLIAMGGERLAIPPWIEISGLCSHPDQAGQGLGTVLLAHLLALHRAEGTRSFLHVGSANIKAISLYERLGFQRSREFSLQRLERVQSSAT